ncbi:MULTISPECIES: ABC transporter permease [unclassified Massilia]|uniref:ABC transporter permease n=1 Tax=unclassified Massilia TaxID=2609279 RepID=UPI001B818822|nr:MULTISPECIES: ABC transporter permease [unclassified Massilia]MBQ5941750.1 ABC transporter permease [Massilia sp. AB1]MBQ5961610.1 ABC transporter permease [Massilia sp. ZL223]
MSKDAVLWPRPSFQRETLDSAAFGVVEKPLSAFEKLYNYSVVRKTAILVFLMVVWEVGARMLGNELLFPTFVATVEAFFRGIASGELILKVWASLKVLLIGYWAGIALAAVLTAIGIASKIGTDFLETLTSMFNPLPAIALLPIALIWFGLGNGSLVFVLVHSVLWAVALNTHSGFLAVSNTMRMVGRNYGLGGFTYVTRILIPAAFPSILTGLKIGWAFAWRTLIASELVFGVSSGSGGLGWFIYENKNMLEIPNVFAGLLTVILIGLVVENLVFRTIENNTVRKWGMQN